LFFIGTDPKTISPQQKSFDAFLLERFIEKKCVTAWEKESTKFEPFFIEGSAIPKLFACSALVRRFKRKIRINICGPKFCWKVRAGSFSFPEVAQVIFAENLKPYYANEF